MEIKDGKLRIYKINKRYLNYLSKIDKKMKENITE